MPVKQPLKIQVAALHKNWKHNPNKSTHSGLVNLGQHRLRYWLGAWWHQAITWTNIDLPSKAICDIELKAISQEALMNSDTVKTLGLSPDRGHILVIYLQRLHFLNHNHISLWQWVKTKRNHMLLLWNVLYASCICYDWVSLSHIPYKIMCHIAYQPWSYNINHWTLSKQPISHPHSCAIVCLSRVF